ncbi:CDP-alcohol phosphatidyltransferase family protein [Roseibacillus ishigakijimensis]|uniref:CDP-alcohol phosphatidyltransferase family protein n=1 Tax=Roseibacillus ishigakijimensis TaxID=454146 RepID=A0A934VNX0_9BACT|nr:CDP-alcohol phosphatidyltransferase family protein [Roseibacillus ishigakijimensis]MBK1835501.1 hypothetical protein [Roseibacillus ishigakijimensis]
MNELPLSTPLAGQSSNRRPVALRTNKMLQRVARHLANRDISPNQISLASVIFAAAAGLSFASLPWLPAEWRFPLALGGGLLVLARGLSNLLDGLVAIEHQRATASGAFFNEAPDRLSDVLILTGVGLAWRADFAGLSAGLLLSLLAMGTAYVRVLGSNLTGTEDYCGPLAKPQRIGLIALALPLAFLLPRTEPALTLLLFTLALGTAGTLLRRLHHLLKTLNHRHS